MTGQQLRFLFDQGEDVTRRKLCFIFAVWPICNLKWHLVAKSLARVLVCVLCFLRDRFFFRFIKTKKSKPPFDALRQAFGFGGADVLKESNGSVTICCCERTQLIL